MYGQPSTILGWPFCLVESSAQMNILCCTKNLELALLRKRVLEQAHFEVEILESEEQVLERIQRGAQNYDVLVLCHSVPVKSAKQYARLMKEHNPKCCRIHSQDTLGKAGYSLRHRRARNRRPAKTH